MLAQDRVWSEVQAELAAGAKTSHWMWFVFPQLRALGRSGTAHFYGLRDREEALAYWRHPVLGPRLAEGARRLLAVPGRSARDIFGPVDELKLRSCMTLFKAVAPQEPAFAQVLDRFFGGREDPLTLNLL